MNTQYLSCCFARVVYNVKVTFKHSLKLKIAGSHQGIFVYGHNNETKVKTPKYWNMQITSSQC